MFGITSKWVQIVLLGVALVVLPAGCQQGGGGGGGGGGGNSASDGDADGGMMDDGSGGDMADDGADADTQGMDEPDPMDDDGMDQDDPEPQLSTLFVVNNDGVPIVSYFADPETLDGEIAPTGFVEAGATSSLFQPRGIAVTTDGTLFVSRANGGIVGYDDAFAINEDSVADREIDGTNTLLEVPISMAYDADNDRLYVGNASGADGILVFDNVSAPEFDGEVSPDRAFGPPDRSPFGTLDMTVDAMCLDQAGNLYVSDAMSDTPNRNRILVFASPATAEGSTEPARSITSDEWGMHEDIFVDSDGVLYVVDDQPVVCIFAGAANLDGDTDPSGQLLIGISQTRLHGIVVTRNGTGVLANEEGSAIYFYDNIASLSGDFAPDRILEGTDTRLRGPRHMWLIEP